jgi:hypothetical protein
MVSATTAMWLRKSAFVVLLIYGGLCTVIGVSGIFLPLALGHRGPLHLWRYILVGPVAALIGAGILMRLRVAAVLLALLFALTGAEEMYGVAHGFGLPNPPQISAAEITCILVFTLLPAVLVVLSWKRLRWVRKPSNQTLQPTAGRSDV